MTPAEKLLKAGFTLEEFRDACNACFAGQSGALLRQMLVTITPPFEAPVGKDAHDTYREIGRQEIVKFLLVMSVSEASISSITNIYTT